MKNYLKTFGTMFLMITIFLCSPVQAREGDQISIVGSSTVFPFATVVAERFGKNTDYKAPVIESTGSGG